MFDFFLVGAQRAGTTHLSDRLCEFVDLHVPRFEVEFFESGVYEHSSQSELDRLLTRERARQQNLATVFGVKRPEYLYDSEVPCRIRRYNTDARIVITWRHPITRLRSAHLWYAREGLIPLASLKNTWAQLQRDRPALCAQYPHAIDLLQFSLYAGALERYLDTFGAAQVMLCTFEALHDPQSLSSVAQFLGSKGITRPAAGTRRRTNASLSSVTALRLARMTAPLGPKLKRSHPYRASSPLRARPIRHGIRVASTRFGSLLDQVARKRLDVDLDFETFGEMCEAFEADHGALRKLVAQMRHVEGALPMNLNSPMESHAHRH